jgi:adenylate cyclase
LGPVLGIDIPDNGLTASLDAKIRKVSTEGLFADLLAARPADIPIVVVLDDVARLDELSLDLLNAIWRADDHLSLHVVGLTRETVDEVPELLRDRMVAEPIVLGPLDDAASATLVRGRLADLYGPDVEPNPDVIDFILQRGEGNPLYLAELAVALHNRNTDITAPPPERDDLPDGLTCLLLSRVDVLPEPSRRTIKIAGVVGRTFEESVVEEADESFGGPGGTHDRLEEFAVARIAEMVLGTEDDWRFRNVLTQEVVYDSLPHSVKVQVHDVVSQVLESRPDAATIVDRIAQHAWLSEDRERQRVWAHRAGIEAQTRYANETAITWFERLAGIAEGRERVVALRRVGEVQETAGEWIKAAAAFQESLDLAEEILDWGGAAWAEAGCADNIDNQPDDW